MSRCALSLSTERGKYRVRVAVGIEILRQLPVPLLRDEVVDVLWRLRQLRVDDGYGLRITIGFCYLCISLILCLLLQVRTLLCLITCIEHRLYRRVRSTLVQKHLIDDDAIWRKVAL